MVAIIVILIVTIIIAFYLGKNSVDKTSVQSYQIEELNKSQKELENKLIDLPKKYDKIIEKQNKQIGVITKQLTSIKELEKQRNEEVKSTYIESNDSTVEYLSRRYNK